MHVIDAHHHLWRYNAEEYGWIDASMAPLQRDFLPADLQATLAAAKVDGAVTVQARQTLEETRWLLELAATCPQIRGVVGWVPLADPHVSQHLERFAAQRHLRGVRHVVQGEPAGFLERSDFNRGIAALRGFNLRYDLLVFHHQLPEANAFVDRHPQQPFVLDHIAKPNIKAGDIEPWRTHLQQLARRPNVWCKLSGMVTEADWQRWTPEGLKPYADAALDAFGPARLMLGSDWPVCLVATPYARWIELVRQWIAPLSPAEQARILGGSAVEFYGL